MSKTLLIARTCFARFFESDLLPPGLPQVQLVIWSLALLAGPGLLMPVALAKRYPALPPPTLATALFTDRLVFLVLTMTSMGFVALVLWQNVFPDKRDARLLGVLPLPSRTLVAGRLLALATLAGVFLAGINAVPTLTFGPLIGYYGGAANVLLGAVGYFAATAGGGAFVFFSLVAAQAACLNAGPRVADRLAPVLQVVFIFALFGQLFFLPRLMALAGVDLSAMAADPIGRHVPFAWFLGLSDTLGGRPGPGSVSLALRAVAAVVGVVGLAFTLLALTHARLLRMAIEGREPSRRAAHTSRSPAESLAALVCRAGPARAIFAFAIRTLLRSRSHHMLLAIYVGVALALIALTTGPLVVRFGAAAFSEPRIPVVAAPLVLLFFLLHGVHTLMAIPVEPKANWIVRLLEPADRVAAMAAVRGAMLTVVVGPIALAAAAGAWIAWGAWPALVHGLVCAGMGWALCEVLLLRVRKLPFTCTWFPGRSRVQLWPFYGLIMSNYCFTTAAIEQTLFAKPLWAAAALPALAVAGVTLATMRARGLASPPGLRFEEEDPDALFAGFSLSEALAARGRQAP